MHLNLNGGSCIAFWCSPTPPPDLCYYNNKTEGSCAFSVTSSAIPRLDKDFATNALL